MSRSARQVFVKVDPKFTSHPKVLEIGPLGEALWLRGLCYTADQMTDGFVPAAFIRRMGDIPDVLSVVGLLVAAGLWDETNGGYMVHDYLEWQRSRAEIEQLSETRAAAGQRGGSKPKASATLAASPPVITSKPTPEQPASKPEANSKQNESKTEADTDTDTDTEAEGELPPNPPRGELSKQQESQFEAFWAAYPRKEGKGAARGWWVRKKPTAELVEQMLAAIEAWKKSLQWRRDGGQYIPHPGTWLNQSRWEDELPPPATAADLRNASAPNRPIPPLPPPERRPAAKTDEEFESRVAEFFQSGSRGAP